MREVLDGAARLRTFTEGMADANCQAGIQEEIEGADQLIFLGFSYQDQNIDLLRVKTDRWQRRIYGSSFGLSPADEDIAVAKVADVYHLGLHHNGPNMSDRVKLFPNKAAAIMAAWGNSFRT